MNQLELNRIAGDFIRSQSVELARKLKDVLAADLAERVKGLAGPTVHHIHNVALFDTMLGINCLFQTRDHSKAAVREYIEHAETLRPDFIDIVDSLKDFEPTGRKEDAERADE